MRKVVMVVRAEEDRMDKLVGGDGMAEMRLGIGMERTGRMAREVESKSKLFERWSLSDSFEAEATGQMARMELRQGASL